MNIDSQLKEKFGPKVIGQVVRILDEHTIIINAGKNDVRLGDSLQIYEYLGDLIGSDGKNYGSFEYVKAEVEVVRCEPYYSICKTEKVTRNSNSSFALSPLLEYQRTYRKELPVDKSDISPLKPENRKVHIGDPIKRA